MDMKLLKEIVKTRKAIRKKFQALKTGRMETETQLEETFKPITKPLEKLVTQIKHEPLHAVKTELKKEMDQYDSDELMTPPPPHKRKHLKMEPASTSSKFQAYSSDAADDDGDEYEDEDEFETPTHSSTLTKAVSMSDIPENVSISEYMKLYVNRSTRIDKAYGVYFDGEDWKIGNSLLKVEDNDIIVSGKRYNITPGLLELIFISNPKKGYTSKDLNNYVTILNDTNAYKRNYEDSGQIKGNRSKKYKDIIKKLAFPDVEGKGLMQVPKANIDYTYWDDPNELVDRLRLLIASQQAGNNSHNNEIVSIIEELREAGIIV